MAATDSSKLECSTCGYLGLYMDEDDGRFYCTNCNSQAADIIDNANADEDFIDKGTHGGAIYNAAHRRAAPVPAPDTEPHETHLGPTEPSDFGKTPKRGDFSEEDYCNAIRQRYVLGLQLMLQFQCESLVQNFGVTPLICGIAASIWLRFLASTRVFDDDWADKTIMDSETGEKRLQVGSHCKKEPRNMLNERMVVIWIKSLKKRIPLSCSLAVSYLACHIAKEPVLPTDIIKWSIEGKLPYFGAFPKIAESIIQIEKYHQHASVVCPLKASSMFKPKQLPLQKLESMAASIAQSVGLNLPPVNFYRIAYRYLKQLSLPVEKILPYACRIQEWSMPPDLWLSASEEKLPSRVCVMSILIVTIRILYNLNGFGKWESTLSPPIVSSKDGQAASFDKSNAKKGAEEAPTKLSGEPETNLLSVHKFESDSTELLRNLEKKYDDLGDKFEYSKDLPTYLQYCKDVVFAGVEPLYKDPTFIEELWDFYEKNREDIKTSGKFESGSNQKRSRDNDKFFSTPSKGSKKHNDKEISSSPAADSGFQSNYNSPNWDPSADNTQQSSQTCQFPATMDRDESSSQNLEDIALKYLKIDMEEHRFCYIPPRVEVKRRDHLHYSRKRGDGSLGYVAHADYYILLRACAKVVQVDIRIMHIGVLSLERRLGWIEKWIDHSLVEKCSGGPVENVDDSEDESVNLSNISI
ncbi:TATA box-binding protein-associated factor RNA polymerase I subunit B-like [Chenopodium quinoa]|uniref:TATA box-binding protein-associated factor RNA polymerase I subunit B-like n=1 Tax=Chenopodium quinoa TaxID=63459 RepID=UPI000B77DFEE|nr:TATA box-binding protein-associated factor RNA polymerase I subunit B-like [Chenopodium quinoa]XP_021763386.1 TATA box-binding protein-associated factor RNA polymerase I subunit B-like [Chenopodium quinoa]XP_021763387.1 TATA box-binding protein-associated factor RNA polymerase I subunit B-like [Chenopodium quinoa]